MPRNHSPEHYFGPALDHVPSVAPSRKSRHCVFPRAVHQRNHGGTYFRCSLETTVPPEQIFAPSPTSATAGSKSGARPSIRRSMSSASTVTSGPLPDKAAPVRRSGSSCATSGRSPAPSTGPSSTVTTATVAPAISLSSCAYRGTLRRATGGGRSRSLSAGPPRHRDPQPLVHHQCRATAPSAAGYRRGPVQPGRRA